MALWLVACAKNAESPQSVEKTSDATTMALHFDAVAGLNPGANGQPAPVRVRIYELKNTASFARADYFALAERAQATLGADLIDQDEVLVQPGQQAPCRAARSSGSEVDAVARRSARSPSACRRALDLGTRRSSAEKERPHLLS
jgi:type VI secretion system VasD/TssJ family lipoprotein